VFYTDWREYLAWKVWEKRPFHKREVHYSFRSKIQTGTPEKRWFKAASYNGDSPSDIVLGKIQQQIYKIRNNFIKNLPSKIQKFLFFNVCRCSIHKNNPTEACVE
jgi:accessory colonization factor AcfC